MKQPKLDLLKSTRDDRDLKYKIVAAKILPLEVDLSYKIKEMKSQKAIGSCGSHAICSAIEIALADTNKLPEDGLSELYHYYKVRVAMGTWPRDSGQTLREGLKVAKENGIAFERFWRYDISKFNDKPPWYADLFAKFTRIKSYNRCYNSEEIKTSLMYGKPVVFGAKIHYSFVIHKGKLLYKLNEDRDMGGHGMIIIGYSESRGTYKVLNSWSRLWGERDMCEISYVDMSKMAFEYWSITYR